MKWTLEEYEMLDTDYDDQVAYSEIARHLNDAFHNGKNIRTISSINSAINRLYNTDIMSKLIEKQEVEWEST